MRNTKKHNTEIEKTLSRTSGRSGKSVKKTTAFLTALSLLYGCCACGNTEGTLPGNGNTEDSGLPVSGTDAAARTISSESGGNPAFGDSGISDVSGLRFLSSDGEKASCSTEEGYYYLSQDTIALSDGSYGSPLMYMDYASCREVYLCSSPGCTHDTPDCTAVLPSEEISPYSSMLFRHQDFLYLLSSKYDSDGTVVVFGEESSSESAFAAGDTLENQTALYRMNPDGTGRQKVYAFDQGLTLEKTIAIDNNGLYVIGKMLSSEKKGSISYTSSSQRRLIYLDLSSLTVTDICSLDFGDNINWRMTGCANGSILFRGTDYGKELTEEEYDNDDLFRNYYLNSSEVFASLNVTDPELREFYRISNKKPLSMAILDGMLYLSFDGSEEIIGVDTATGEERTAASLPQTYIWGTLGDMLYCHSWDLMSDHTCYFVNPKTGEIHHSGLVNKSLGWSLDIMAETEKDALVIYDYEATPSQLNDDAYEIHRYQYGLISKEDLYAGKDNYRKIQMVGKGE